MYESPGVLADAAAEKSADLVEREVIVEVVVGRDLVGRGGRLHNRKDTIQGADVGCARAGLASRSSLHGGDRWPAER